MKKNSCYFQLLDESNILNREHNVNKYLLILLNNEKNSCYAPIIKFIRPEQTENNEITIIGFLILQTHFCIFFTRFFLLREKE
jgi:hypothetical protein